MRIFGEARLALAPGYSCCDLSRGDTRRFGPASGLGPTLTVTEFFFNGHAVRFDLKPLPLPLASALAKLS